MAVKNPRTDKDCHAQPSRDLRVAPGDLFFFENLVRNIFDGIVATDHAGVVLSYNPACENLFRYPEAEVLGQSLSMLFEEKDTEGGSCLVRYLECAGNQAGMRREVWGRRKDGSTLPLELSVSRFESGGKPIFACVLRDISERIRIRAEREGLIEKLTESNAEFERFAYVASHDMQEPLRAMSSFSEILVSEHAGALDEEGSLYLRMIHDAAARMQAMVVDLLDYARVGKERAPFELFGGDEEYTHAIENLANAVEGAGARLSCDRLPQLKGHAVQFSRLLQNLIGNSLKYRRADDAPVIAVHVEDKGECWHFSVEDNGIGIDAENLTRIFEPFKRLHNRKKYAGTGLGLSVCKKIVENHAGKIWCVSTLGQGSVFHFTWPK